MASKGYIGLGSNMGDRRAALCRALEGIAALPSTEIAEVSSIYETAPWGLVDQPAFLNCVAAIDTELDPFVLLQSLLTLEVKLGRTRDIRWGPRLIDLDLLLYDAVEISSESLVLPHPLMTKRAFVLVPLLELDDVIINGKRTSEHLSLLANERIPGDVVLWGPPPCRICSSFA